MQPTNINAANWAKLCEWMEPKPISLLGTAANFVDLERVQWWRRKPKTYTEWIPTLQTLDACALAEAEIERRGLKDAYTFELLNIAGYATTELGTGFWTMIRLISAQRTAAMVAVIEANHE